MQVPYSVAPTSTTSPTTATEPSSTLLTGQAPIVTSASGTSATRRLLCRLDADAAGTLVRRLLIVGPAGSAAAVYIGDPPGQGPGGVQPAYQVDLTRRGAGDVATYDPPLYVAPSKCLLIVWDVQSSSAQLAAASTYARVERA